LHNYLNQGNALLELNKAFTGYEPYRYQKNYEILGGKVRNIISKTMFLLNFMEPCCEDLAHVTKSGSEELGNGMTIVLADFERWIKHT
jgi:hypothetical protein